MLFSITSVRLQTMVVFAPSIEVSGSSTSSTTTADASGLYQSTTSLVTSTSSLVGIAPGLVGNVTRSESLILKDAFSSVPVISQQEIAHEYQELGTALADLTEFEIDDQWKIDAPVYQVACHVAAELMAYSFPAPHIFTHGPKSVVFNWEHNRNNLYLTISADHISALVSTPERIKRRLEFSAKGLLNPAVLFPAIQAAHMEQPIVSTRDAMSDSAQTVY